MKVLAFARFLVLPAATVLSLGAVAAAPPAATAKATGAVKVGTVHRIKNVNSAFDLGCPRSVNVLKSTCLVTVTGGRVGEGVSVIKNGVPASPKQLDSGGIIVACATVSGCVVASDDTGDPTVEWLVNGKPTGSTTVSGMTTVNGIACETKKSCVVIGAKQPSFTKSYGEVALVNKGEKKASAQTVHGAHTLDSISCGSPHQCVAAGANAAGESGRGVVVPITDGKPGTVRKVPGTWSVAGISCGSAHVCYGAGEIYSVKSNAQTEHLLAIKNGKPSKLGAATHVSGLSCWSAHYCAGHGDDGGPGVLFARVNFGKVGPTTRTGKMGTISGFACPTSAACLAVGMDSHGHPATVVVNL